MTAGTSVTVPSISGTPLVSVFPQGETLEIRSRIERVIDIRPGEGARTALMFFTILLLIASYTTTKAVRDAVFLSKFGLTELSYMYIAIAVCAGVMVTGYKRITAGSAATSSRSSPTASSR